VLRSHTLTLIYLFTLTLIEVKMAEAPVDTSTLSEEEKRLIFMMRTLNIEPHIEDEVSMVNVARALRGDTVVKTEPPTEPKKPSNHHYPKFSIFYGDGRGEVSWDTFKYEVASVLAEDSYTDEQIMFGIRRSLKGPASDK